MTSGRYFKPPQTQTEKKAQAWRNAVQANAEAKLLQENSRFYDALGTAGIAHMLPSMAAWLSPVVELDETSQAFLNRLQDPLLTPHLAQLHDLRAETIEVDGVDPLAIQIATLRDYLDPQAVPDQSVTAIIAEIEHARGESAPTDAA